jgi:hypothetical protein
MQDRKPTDLRKPLATHGRTIHCGLKFYEDAFMRTRSGRAVRKAKGNPQSSSHDNQGHQSDGDIGGLALRHGVALPCGPQAGGQHRRFRGARHQARSTAPVISAVTSSGEVAAIGLSATLLAAAQDGYPIGAGEDVRHSVTDEDDGLAVVAHAAHQIEDLGHLTHRNRCGGLVEQSKSRPAASPGSPA